jgi:hypothetical protein
VNNRLFSSNKDYIEDFVKKMEDEGILFCLLVEQEEDKIVSMTNMHEFGRQGLVDMIEGFSVASTSTIKDYLYDEEDLDFIDEDDDDSADFSSEGDITLN